MMRGKNGEVLSEEPYTGIIGFDLEEEEAEAEAEEEDDDEKDEKDGDDDDDDDDDYVSSSSINLRRRCVSSPMTTTSCVTNHHQQQPPLPLNHNNRHDQDQFFKLLDELNPTTPFDSTDVNTPPLFSNLNAKQPHLNSQTQRGDSSASNYTNQQQPQLQPFENLLDNQPKDSKTKNGVVGDEEKELAPDVELEGGDSYPRNMGLVCNTANLTQVTPTSTAVATSQVIKSMCRILDTVQECFGEMVDHKKPGPVINNQDFLLVSTPNPSTFTSNNNNNVGKEKGNVKTQTSSSQPSQQQQQQNSQQSQELREQNINPYHIYDGQSLLNRFNNCKGVIGHFLNYVCDNKQSFQKVWSLIRETGPNETEENDEEEEENEDEDEDDVDDEEQEDDDDEEDGGGGGGDDDDNNNNNNEGEAEEEDEDEVEDDDDDIVEEAEAEDDVESNDNDKEGRDSSECGRDEEVEEINVVTNTTTPTVFSSSSSCSVNNGMKPSLKRMLNQHDLKNDVDAIQSSRDSANGGTSRKKIRKISRPR